MYHHLGINSGTTIIDFTSISYNKTSSVKTKRYRLVGCGVIRYAVNHKSVFVEYILIPTFFP